MVSNVVCQQHAMKMRKVFNEHDVMSPVAGISPGNPGLVNGVGVAPAVRPTQTRPKYEGGPFGYNEGAGHGAMGDGSEPARLQTPKMLCRTPGCSFFSVPEFNGYCCSNCNGPPR